MITFNVQFVVKNRDFSKIIFDYSRANFDKINEELINTDWDKLLLGDTENIWNIFKDRLSNLENVPTKLVGSPKCHKPIWMSYNAVKLVVKKRQIFAKYHNRHHPAVKAANVKASKAIKKAKRMFEQKLASNIKSDSKSFFAYVRSKSKANIKVRSLTDNFGNKIDSIEENCEHFNEYFSSVFTTEDTITLPEPIRMFHLSDDLKLTNIDISIEVIDKVLQKLRIDKAAGVDNLSPRLLFHIKEGIRYPLYTIFNKSLNAGGVPLDWRRAYVSPIHKKGCQNLAENYRPISLTSQICKLFETILREHIVNHLDEKNLLYDSQHGFRKGRSCLSNLLTFLDDVTNLLDNGDCVDVAYLDFAKAFDKIPHQRLISKLRNHGIDGNVLRWIENWLKDRHQSVKFLNTMSGWRNVTSGVPQGSVLGPILFLIYINDIDNGIEKWLLKFADDIKVIGKVQNSDDHKLFQSVLDRIEKWSSDWLMLLQAKKCKVVHIERNNPKYEYIINGEKLEEVNVEKDLGIMISSDMKVSSQCIAAYNKANRMLGLLKRTISLKSADILVKLYKTLVRPHVEYCTVAWSPHYIKDKELIEKNPTSLHENDSRTEKKRLMRLELGD